jgi:hypothetical protein
MRYWTCAAVTEDNAHYAASHRELWNEWAARHGDRALTSTVRRLNAPRSTTLRDSEIAEVGDPGNHPGRPPTYPRSPAGP